MLQPFWKSLIVSLFFFFFNFFYLFYLFFLICSEFCHTLKWNSLGFTRLPHPDPPSHLPLHPLPPGLPRAPGPSACLMHPTWLVICFSWLIVSLKVKHMLTIRTSSSTLRNRFNRDEDVSTQRIVNVHCSRIHNSQKLENNPNVPQMVISNV